MANWSRIARRIRVPLSFAFAIAYVWLAHPTRTSLMAGALLLVPGLLLRGLASGHVQKTGNSLPAARMHTRAIPFTSAR